MTLISDSAFSINVLFDDSLCQSLPRRLLLDVVSKRTNARRRHVINEDIRLGREAFKYFRQSVDTRNFATIFRTATGPQEKVTTLVSESLQPFSRAVKEPAVGINQGKVHIDEDIGVFHRRRPGQTSQNLRE